MKRRGFTLIELLVVVAIIALLIAILLPSLGKAKELSNRSYCAANARGIMHSMVIYAADGDTYPATRSLTSGTVGTVTYKVCTAAGGGTAMGITTSSKTTADAAISDFYNGTITGGDQQVLCSVWILCLKGQLHPKELLCKSDPVGASNAGQINSGAQFWMLENDGQAANDFDYSYSFAQPWSGNTLAGYWKNTNNAGVAIVSDMAPLSGSKGNPDASTPITAQGGNPAAGGIKAACSANHQRDGQTVGYADGHANFERRPDVGQSQDNIWTTFGTTTSYWQGTAMTGGSITGLNNVNSEPYDIVMVPVADIGTGARK